MDRGEQVVGRRVQCRASVEHAHAEALEQRAHPGAGHDRKRTTSGRAAVGPGEALVAALDLVVHVGDIEVRDDASPGEQGRRRVRVIGMDVNLERRRVPDHQHRVAELLELLDEEPLLEAAPGDREVRAVSIRARGVLQGG